MSQVPGVQNGVRSFLLSPFSVFSTLLMLTLLDVVWFAGRLEEVIRGWGVPLVAVWLGLLATGYLVGQNGTSQSLDRLRESLKRSLDDARNFERRARATEAATEATPATVASY